ncbi:hypothetical protein [Sulfuricurvum sp.]|uniref:hypothetical protein n=1 Tax=Sulfuricurvum sp. TaxID=2025608 RepID=UPI0026303A8D|nr:hypothetical protein [Sulfuricurvum sp.]MDD2266318.1 hypothetical protein [Sulfuricurvum sp.]MDD2784742.1 hypothetical protein [Sulfuricurvum sp.]
MHKTMIKSVGIWLLIIIAAIINGAIREKLLTPFIGADLSIPISGITLSVLVFVITYFALPFFGHIKSRTYIFIGLFWIILRLAFEYLFGHYVMGKSWYEINHVFDIRNGNLFTLALVVTALSPWTAAKLKG